LALPILDQLNALGDSTRSRLLLALDRHELTVGELCQTLQLPQSTVSRHLRTLSDEGWVVSRAEGTSRQYRLASLDAGARRLWQLVREQVAESPVAAHDRERLRSILAERRLRSQEFFSTAAAEWDALRAELYGETADLHATLGLLDDEWVVGDLGCGTGRLAAALAPFVARVVAVDASRQMLQAARRRLGGVDNVELRQGELEQLPLESGSLDAAVAFLVLHYLVEPARALAEARRVLAPGGRLLVVDMLPHGRDEFRRLGHVWPGFAREQLEEWLREAGLERVRYRALPPDPQAKGPVLFAATARVPGAGT
jgi:ArsR family transcriptional regulator